MGIFQDDGSKSAMYWQNFEHCSNPYESYSATSAMTPTHECPRVNPTMPRAPHYRKMEDSHLNPAPGHVFSVSGVMNNIKLEQDKENYENRADKGRSSSENGSPLPCEQSTVKLENGCLDCAGCGVKIVDKFYLVAVDKPWHASCLRCYECKHPLDTDITCFARKGHIYCKEDYYRLFSVRRCARCQVGIATSELVMRAKDYVYHVNCFMCTMCGHSLSKGDHFGMRNHLIYCRTHFELLSAQEYQQSSPSCSLSSPVPFQLMDQGVSSFYPQVPGIDLTSQPMAKIPMYNGVGVTQKGRPRKRKSKDSDETGHSLGNDVSLETYGLEAAFPGQSSRPKRVRTSFKHHQLRTMKSYFTINHNPDAKDLKQLSQKTGLSKRVLQVWFQNARAKWRRSMIRQQKGLGDKVDTTSQSLSEMSSPEYVGDQEISMTEDSNSGMYPQFSPEMT